MNDSNPRTDGRSSLRRLLTPKWLLGHLLALGLVVLFVNFGLWQLRRLEQRTASNELMLERLAAPPVDLEALLPEAAADPESIAYRRAFTSGTFRPEHEILLRNRSREGQPGWHLLTPLQREDGTAVLVDRGWVPRAFDRPPVEEAAPPAGEVRIEGRVLPEEDPPEGWVASLSPRDPPEGELDRSYYVDVERLAPQFPFELAPIYLELTGFEPTGATSVEREGDLDSGSNVADAAAAEGAPPLPGNGQELGASGARRGGSELPLPPLTPEFSRGSHLSYALQWFSFALIGVVGYSILLWRTAREPESP